jgi:hypothetical protein
MNAKCIPAVCVLSAMLAFALPAQQTVQIEYKGSVDKATKAYDQKAWGECVKQLRNAMMAAQKQRTDAIRAAMPAAPAGMKFEDDKNDNEAANMWVAGIGNQVTRNYRNDDGDRSISLRVQADSPMVAMMLPMLTNPVAVQASHGEMLTYDKQKAVLTKQGDDGKNWKLQIVVDSAHLIEIDAQGFDRAGLLKVFDDAAVGKLAKELMN